MSIKDIKHNFLAYRNGIVADTLRKAGQPFGIIFGLQLPQIRQIARDVMASITDDSERQQLARELLADTNVRESRILAFAVMPPDSLSYAEAADLCKSILTREEADLLPFLLLRFTTHIPELIADDSIDGDFSDYLRQAMRRFSD